MTSSDAETSSEDDLSKLKESVDQHFLKADLYDKNSTTCNETTKTSSSQPPASLRRNVDAEDEALNLFHVTPEFQNYVAKHLADKLEKDLKHLEVAVPTIQETKPKRKAKGIKLLHSSLHKLKVPKCNDSDVYEVSIHNAKVNKKLHDFDEEAHEELCKMVAVDGQDILSKKDVKYWSNRSKAEVFSYKKVKRGKYQYQEKPFVSVTYK
ncbi:protein CUSTOS-like [Atheta coriaria]|uniref:protein CUSTOS-like n=1 Tax=Dalotia coriaria TaxID=877792 RepID=UPI0031F469A0